MGLASIPWLHALLVAVGNLAVSVWKTIKTIWAALAAFSAWAWSGLLSVLAWVITTRGIVVTALVVLCFGAVRSALALIPSVSVVRDGWQSLLDLFPGFSWFIWDSGGVLRLACLFQHIDIPISAWVACTAATTAIRILRFNIMVALNTKLTGGK